MTPVASAPPPDPARLPAPGARVRLDLAYDGSAFSGWARQPGRRTVQAELEAALTVLGLGSVALVVAGRTDAGVHAEGQVAHADLPGGHPLTIDHAGLLRRLNGILATDIRVREVSAAPSGFDARFSALARCYRYRADDSPGGPSPLRRHDTARWSRRLHLDRLSAASAPLLGLQDFASFCRRREGATTVRTLQRLEWSRDSAGVVEAAVEADAFCHGMVRAVVGVVLRSGDGRLGVEQPARLLAALSREGAPGLAPARGLTLAEVQYPPAEQLRERAELTRRQRETAITPERPVAGLAVTGAVAAARAR